MMMQRFLIARLQFDQKYSEVIVLKQNSVVVWCRSYRVTLRCPIFFISLSHRNSPCGTSFSAIGRIIGTSVP